jgi:hypothetical protein
MVRRIVWQKSTDISEELSASTIRVMSALMLEAISTTETSVGFYQTKRCTIPEDSHLHHPTLLTWSSFFGRNIS